MVCLWMASEDFFMAFIEFGKSALGLFGSRINVNRQYPVVIVLERILDLVNPFINVLVRIIVPIITGGYIMKRPCYEGVLFGGAAQ